MYCAIAQTFGTQDLYTIVGIIVGNHQVDYLEYLEAYGAKSMSFIVRYEIGGGGGGGGGGGESELP